MSLAQQVIDELQYTASPNFLRPGPNNSFNDAADFSHIFRRAKQYCQLHGVYSLRQLESDGRDSVVPVVYVCEAKDEQEVDKIHRLVWNQNIVPFLIVVSPKDIRLYSGFRYESPHPDADPALSGILGTASSISEALRFLEAFHAARINDGTIWERWGGQVTPETRVDWKLLSSLNDLDAWLRNNGVKEPQVSHALIGKYVYLQYLKDRDILSDRKLAKWGLESKQIFGRNAQAAAFWKVVGELDDWLNGSVFPLKSSGADCPRAKHIRKVAATFAGDDPTSGQLSLDFDAYDFSFIPIETLSVIYEQFLHAPDPQHGTSRGKSQGAYYTPVTLVNFMLEELDALHPFEAGMRVLDPACGSGAFLVQCYRRIIERDKEFTPGKPMRPSRLRDLLERHIFGIDRDPDACRVAEMSLSLTLLDYVDPPDLERTPKFQLPKLHGRNIFRGDFFDPKASWRNSFSPESFDWIVGNPPWIELKSGSVSDEDQSVWKWFKHRDNQAERPTGGNQAAEAFAWEVVRYVKEDGIIALLLPAMTLFKKESRRFRQQFFAQLQIHTVANFANLAYVLFPGHNYTAGRLNRDSRPERPAAAIFYSNRKENRTASAISVFSPLIADQPANRPNRPGAQKDTWNITIDANQIRTIDITQINDGKALAWKTAMWGSHLDCRLLASLSQKFDSLQMFVEKHGLEVSQGFELRPEQTNDPIEPIPELVGQSELKMVRLRNCGRIFEIPDAALEIINSDRANIRIRGGRVGLVVSHPPHIIVDRARRFAVYSDDFIAVPNRQIGISGDASKSVLLKSLSLFLVSDFAIYHQFLLSPEWGISTSISTLETLRLIPVPLSEIGRSQLTSWAKLHSRIVAAARNRDSGQPSLFQSSQSSEKLSDLLQELNDSVFELLQLREDERMLVEDLVHVRMQLIKGKVPKDAVREPASEELTEYGRVLRDELNEFVNDQPGLNHAVTIVQNGKSAMLAVTLEENASARRRIVIEKADSATYSQFADIRDRVQSLNSQWMYFRRNLRLYEGRTTYVFKPLQRLHWTKSQALLDAGSIIAETLS